MDALMNHYQPLRDNPSIQSQREGLTKNISMLARKWDFKTYSSRTPVSNRMLNLSSLYLISWVILLIGMIIQYFSHETGFVVQNRHPLCRQSNFQKCVWLRWNQWNGQTAPSMGWWWLTSTALANSPFRPLDEVDSCGVAVDNGSVDSVSSLSDFGRWLWTTDWITASSCRALLTVVKAVIVRRKACSIAEIRASCFSRRSMKVEQSCAEQCSPDTWPPIKPLASMAATSTSQYASITPVPRPLSKPNGINDRPCRPIRKEQPHDRNALSPNRAAVLSAFHHQPQMGSPLLRFLIDNVRHGSPLRKCF